MGDSSLSQEEKWIVKGIPALFIIGTLVHFLYNLLGESILVGLFAPVNESVFEHSKLILWPMILLWTVYYMVRGKMYAVDANRWFSSALVALLTALFLMPMLYYFYTGAFGIEVIWVDILIFAITVSLSQLLGLHYYMHGKPISKIWVWIIFAALVILFAVLTFVPPQLPLFQDPLSGTYGI